MTEAEWQMTEAEWQWHLEKADSHGFRHLMQLLVLEGESGITDRNVQLFVVACARRIKHPLPNDLYQRTVELAEQAADSPEMLKYPPLAIYAEIQAAMYECGPAPDFLPRPPFDPLTEQAYELVAELAYPEQVGARVHYMGGQAATLAALITGEPDTNPEADYQIALRRDIFSNLFRKSALDPSWCSSNVVALAAQMYETRDFGAMPILADALQDAGCDSADILNHCRGEGPHVRGCWVVDLVLGKE